MEKRFLDVCLKNSLPLNKLKLFNGLSNWCAWGKTGLDKKEYITHVRTIHNGISLSQSVLNRLPWVNRIFFYSDEAETYYNGPE